MDTIKNFHRNRFYCLKQSRVIFFSYFNHCIIAHNQTKLSQLSLNNKHITIKNKRIRGFLLKVGTTPPFLLMQQWRWGGGFTLPKSSRSRGLGWQQLRSCRSSKRQEKRWVTVQAFRGILTLAVGRAHPFKSLWRWTLLGCSVSGP